MTTTADWLHLRLGTPLPELSADDADVGRDAEENAGEIVARQRARAALPLSVVFTGR
jgi:hypothetical protein